MTDNLSSEAVVSIISIPHLPPYKMGFVTQKLVVLQWFGMAQKGRVHLKLQGIACKTVSSIGQAL